MKRIFVLPLSELLKTVGIIFLITCSFSYQGIAQFVRNGSFEIHRDNKYPNDITGATDYHINQLMKCIGFRLDPQRLTFGWDPLLPTMRRGEKLFVSLSAVEMYFFLFQIIINICMYPFATKI